MLIKTAGPYQPQMPFEIDWGHPLAEGLRFAFISSQGAGKCYDSVFQYFSKGIPSGAAPYAQAKVGVVSGWASSDNGEFGGPTFLAALTYDFTMAAAVTDSVSSTTIQQVFGVQQESGSYIGSTLYINRSTTGAGNSNVYSARYAGEGYKRISATATGSLSTDANTFNHIVITSRQADDINKIYIGSKLQATTDVTNGGWANIGTGIPASLASNTAGGDPFKNQMAYCYYWVGKGFLQCDVDWLYCEPYAFIIEQTIRTYFIPGVPSAGSDFWPFLIRYRQQQG